MKNSYLVYIPHTPAIVELSGEPYRVVCKNDVCILEIDSSLVGQAMTKSCGCCGNQRSCFRAATDLEIEEWKK